MSQKTSAAFASITAAFFLVVAGCGSDADRHNESPNVSVASSVSPTDSPSARWNRLDGSTQNLVCLQALERGGPDYRGMLRELMTAGISQPDAAAMLSHATDQCH